MRDSEAADDVLPHELGDVFVLDASVCFSFYPFTKVICGDEQEFLLGSCGFGSASSEVRIIYLYLSLILHAVGVSAVQELVLVPIHW